MFECRILIDSNCGLSKLSDELEAPVNVTFVNTVGNGDNLAFSYSKSDVSPGRLEFHSEDIISQSISSLGKFLVMNSLKKGHGVTQAIVQNGGFPVFPITIGSGVERISCIVRDKEIGERILRDIERRNNIEEADISRLGSADIITLMDRGTVSLQEQLTTLELEILRSAISQGYYDWPREYNLGDVATRFHIKKPTALYHLRNAERKILAVIFR